MHLPWNDFEAKMVNITFLLEICIVGKNTSMHCSRITVPQVDVNIIV